jgi:hypothetical protein
MKKYIIATLFFFITFCGFCLPYPSLILAQFPVETHITFTVHGTTCTNSGGITTLRKGVLCQVSCEHFIGQTYQTTYYASSYSDDNGICEVNFQWGQCEIGDQIFYENDCPQCNNPNSPNDPPACAYWGGRDMGYYTVNSHQMYLDILKNQGTPIAPSVPEFNSLSAAVGLTLSAAGYLFFKRKYIQNGKNIFSEKSNTCG